MRSLTLVDALNASGAVYRFIYWEHAGHMLELSRDRRYEALGLLARPDDDPGQFYWGLPVACLAIKRLFDRHSCPTIILRWRVLDNDSEDDLWHAELLWNLVGEYRND